MPYMSARKSIRRTKRETAVGAPVTDTVRETTDTRYSVASVIWLNLPEEQADLKD